MTNDPIDSICINTIRTLSMDAVQKASSGHPGTPMAMAPVLYVKALAAPHTVNTMPEKTLLALADHGEIGAMLPHDRGDAGRALGALTRAGIDVDRLAADLQREGAAAFVKSWDALLACIERADGRVPVHARRRFHGAHRHSERPVQRPQQVHLAGDALAYLHHARGRAASQQVADLDPLMECLSNAGTMKVTWRSSMKRCTKRFAGLVLTLTVNIAIAK